MSKGKTKSTGKRQRRRFSAEFKAEAVRLVVEEEASVAEAARNLGIGENLLRRWKAQFEKSDGNSAVSKDERSELERLRARLSAGQ